MAKHTTIEARSFRPPQDSVPKTKSRRQQLLEAVDRYVDENRPVPPLSLDELRFHAGRVVKSTGAEAKYTDFTAVLLSNAVWWPTVAAIPYHKRLLLLPKCMRDSRRCPAEFDDIGLLCEHCGGCLNDEFKRQAEQLGYAVLIAEGSPIVMSLVKTGRIDAIIGVSCLSVLESVFPYMDAGAVPGIAIPLLYDGCKDTSVDADWVWEAIYRTSRTETGRLNLDKLRKEVDSWFSPRSLEALLGPPASQVQRISLDWLSGTGKRWRPFLAVAVHQAIMADAEATPGEDIKTIAVAVECFHKASLIHDDIEDADELRYGARTLHAEYGIPIALNVGDFLLGEGYRLLTELNCPDRRKAAMLSVAAAGHRNLCIGQGSELAWMSRPAPLPPEAVIEIYRKKTSPAFEVALKLGAVCAGCDEELMGILTDYSDALGIAYQIRDDIEEFFERKDKDGIKALKPSLLLALAHRHADSGTAKLLESLWAGKVDIESVADRIQGVFIEQGILRAASDMMELYKSRALSCLAQLTNPDLKGLLRRVISKIFNEIDVMGCCNDYQARHARSRRQGHGSTQ